MPSHEWADFYRRMFAVRGHHIDRESRILDFGCGAGGLVYEFHDAGFNACGFDIHDCLSLRSPGDRQYFQIASKGGDTSDCTLDWAQYRLPYDDATFDFVVSSQTLEHVLNLDAVMAELGRVMKPDGIAIHSFPPRYKPIEGHTCVPFGGMTKSWCYNYLWALIGIRNEFQKELSAKETAARNARYARTGTNYPPILKLRATGRKHYGNVRFAPELWYFAEGKTGWRLTRPALIAYTLFKQVVWVLERPRHHDSPKPI